MSTVSAQQRMVENGIGSWVSRMRRAVGGGAESRVRAEGGLG